MNDKENAELMLLRRCVEEQREEIRRLQTEKDENDKMQAELVHLRECVERQRRMIQNLQNERRLLYAEHSAPPTGVWGGDRIIVRQLMMVTTEKIVLQDAAGNMDTLEKRGTGHRIAKSEYLPLHVFRVRICDPFRDDGKPFLLVETEEGLP